MTIMLKFIIQDTEQNSTKREIMGKRVEVILDTGYRQLL